MKVIRFLGSEVAVIIAAASVIFAALAVILSTIQKHEKSRKRKTKKVRYIANTIIFLVLLSLISYLFLQFSHFEKDPPVETQTYDKIAESTLPIQTETFLLDVQDQAHAIHRPYIQFNNAEYVFQIEEEMSLPSDLASCSVYRPDEYGNADYHFKLDLETRNIGTETAKDIKITISEEASFKAIEEFNNRSSYCDMTYNSGIHGYWIEYSDGSFADFLWFEDSYEMQYILPNAEEIQYYELPTVYYCLINAMRIEHKHEYYDPFSASIMIPNIEIEIEYADIQGTIYKEKAYIHTEAGYAFSGGRSLVVSIIPNA